MKEKRLVNVAEAEKPFMKNLGSTWISTVSYTHLRAHETVLDLVCRLLLEKKKTSTIITLRSRIIHKIYI